jgi:NADH-quinone oxidoreductase subunit G
VGYLTEASNTVGAQLVGAQPNASGLNAVQMLGGDMKALVLLNVEPRFDSQMGPQAVSAVASAQMVVTLSPFKSNMDCSDVLLPISPFTETAGSFVNAEGRLQSFHAVVKPLGETRPGWKVLRALGSMLGLSAFVQETQVQVLHDALPEGVSGEVISLKAVVASEGGAVDLSPATVEPRSVGIYQLDAIVRRAPSLQATADGRQGTQHNGVSAP